MDSQGYTFRPRGILLDPRGILLDSQGYTFRPRGILLDPRGILLDPQTATTKPLGLVGLPGRPLTVFWGLVAETGATKNQRQGDVKHSKILLGFIRPVH